MTPTAKQLQVLIPPSSNRLIWSLLLSHGKFFVAHPLPKGIRRGTFKACYQNSYSLLKRHGERMGLTYAEGVAVDTSGLSFLHGWCVDGNGNVFDPTWNKGIVYFGVALNSDYVFAEMKRRFTTDSPYYGFLDDWENDFPIIKRMTPEEWKCHSFDFLEGWNDGEPLAKILGEESRNGVA